jgi:hypothetical protein
VVRIASYPLLCFMCGTHKRHQRPKLQPKEEKKTYAAITGSSSSLLLSSSSGSERALAGIRLTVVTVVGSREPVLYTRKGSIRREQGVHSIKQREPVPPVCGITIHTVRDSFASVAHHSHRKSFTHPRLTPSPVLLASLLEDELSHRKVMVRPSHSRHGVRLGRPNFGGLRGE